MEKKDFKKKNKGNGKGKDYKRYKDKRNPKSNQDGNTSDGYKSYDSLDSNDINWWNKAKYIYDEVTKVPFNRLLGDLITLKDATSQRTAEAYSIPGIMTVDYAPTIGYCDSPTDAVNLAMDRIYGYIYRQYTGAQNFTKSDLAFQILQEASIANLIAAAKRGLRSLYSYSEINHNLPRLLYSACGFRATAFDNEIDNYNATIARLNQIIISFNSLFTPRFTEVFDRWYSLSNNVWCDDETIDSQMYLFRPCGYYSFVEAEDDTASYLQFNGFSYESFNSGAGMVIGDLLTMAETQLAAIRNTSYFNIVNAAIGKAFANNQLLVIDPFVNGEIISPVFSRNMNWQLNNLKADFLINIYTNNSDMRIVEDVINNTLKCCPRVTAAYFSNLPKYSRYMLNSYDGNIDDEFIMESTRLMCIPSIAPGGVTATVIEPVPISCGTEIPGYISIYYLGNNGTTYTPTVRSIHNITTSWVTYTDTFTSAGSTAYSTTFSTSLTNISVTDPDCNRMLFILSLWTKFRNAPLIDAGMYGTDVTDSREQLTTVTSNSKLPVLPLGDVYKFTFIEPSGVAGLHLAARISVFTMVVDDITK